MHRTDAEDNVDGRFTDGSAEQGRLATVIGAKWLNSVQEEIANLLEENGVILDPENESQLAEMFAPFLAGKFEEITLSETSGGYSKKVKLDNESVAVQDGAPGSVKSATLNADGLVARVSSSVGGAESELKCNELVFKDVNGNVLSSLKKDDLNFGNAHLKLSSGDDSTLVISTTNAPAYTSFKNSKMTSSSQGNTAEINGSSVTLTKKISGNDYKTEIDGDSIGTGSLTATGTVKAAKFSSNKSGQGTGYFSLDENMLSMNTGPGPYQSSFVVKIPNGSTRFEVDAPDLKVENELKIGSNNVSIHDYNPPGKMKDAIEIDSAVIKYLALRNSVNVALGNVDIRNQIGTLNDCSLYFVNNDSSSSIIVTYEDGKTVSVAAGMTRGFIVFSGTISPFDVGQ